MMFDISSFIVIIVFTGLSVLLHEFLIKNHVSTKGNRIFFYFLLVLHLLAFQKFSFLNELSFSGNLSVVNLRKFDIYPTTNEHAKNNFEIIILLIYLVGVIIGSIKMTLGILKIIRLIVKSSPGKNKFERVVNVSNFAPCTFFKYVLIPLNLPKTIYNSVYEHEKYHAYKLHTIDKILWSILSILFWFNPFVHLLKSRQSLNLEYDTDQHLIKFIPKNEYSKHLLSSTFKAKTVDFYPMFDRSNIYRRVKRLNRKQKHSGLLSGTTLILTFLLLFSGTILSKASFLTTSGANINNQISKPKFEPNGYGTYIDLVFQAKAGDKLDNIDSAYRLNLFLNITINKEGEVIRVSEDSGKSRKGSDVSMDNFISGLLKETIKNMPRWTPAKKNGIPIESTIQEEFLLSGESE